MGGLDSGVFPMRIVLLRWCLCWVYRNDDFSMCLVVFDSVRNRFRALSSSAIQ